MTVLYQPFDGGGANGAAIDWSDSEAVGAPVYGYTDGAGTFTYTTDSPIRGATSARILKPAGTGVAALICTLGGGVTAVRSHVYLRVPTGIPTDGFQVVNVQSGHALHVMLKADGSVTFESWGTLVGTAAPAGTLPAAGTLIRVAVGVTSGGTASAAIYAGQAATPLWQTSGASGVTGDLSEFQVGAMWTSSAGTALDLTVDDLRVETGTAAPMLPPEVLPESTTWVREPVGWRRLSQPDAVQEGYTPPSTVGALPPGTQTYPAPGAALYVSPTGNDTSGIGTAAAPYATIAKALTVASAGATIVLRAGNHRVGVAPPTNPASYNVTTMWAGQTGDVANLTIQAYPGEAAWLDGSTVHTGWTKVGAVWEKPLVLSHDRSPTGTYGNDDYTDPNWRYINTDHPYAAWPERVWVDGVELTQVANRAEVTAGRFCVEGTTGGTGNKLFTSSKYVIGTDPTAKEVRVAELATCMSSTGSGFTLRGVGIRRYAGSVSQRGVFKLRHADCRIENVTFEDLSAIGITLFEAHRSVLQNLTVRRVGMNGIEGTESDDLILDRLDVTDCNRQGFNYAPEAGGIKLTHMRRPVIRNSAIYRCACSGIWLDESVSQGVIHSCDVQWVDNIGIVSELSGGTTVANCFIGATGADCVNIFNTSGAVRVWNNTLTRPGRLSAYGRCLSITADDRAPLKAGSVGLDPRFGFPHPDGVDALTVDVTVKNNILGPSTAQGLLWNEDFQVNSGNARSYTAFGIKSNNNVHVVRRGKPDWKWVLSSAGAASPTILWDLGDLTSRGLDTASAALLDDYAADLAGKQTTRAAAERPTGAPLPADVAGFVGAAAGATSVVGAVR